MYITFLLIFGFFLFFLLIFLFRKSELFFRKEFKNQKDEIFSIIQSVIQKDVTEKNFRNFIELKYEYKSLLKEYQNSTKNIILKYFDNQNDQCNKIDSLSKEQKSFIKIIEKNVDEVKDIFYDKFQSSMNFHLGKSFEIIGNQLGFVQKGLGEMKILIKDISSLKRTLNHVKICGSFSEMQLSMLLKQILSPEQYATNVITKSNTKYFVEFAIKLPGVGKNNIWLPIDVKFPKETYEKLQYAYHKGDKKEIKIAMKNMESVLRKMSKDIRDKYIDPPNTTDFAILFLPFEGIYAEITKNSGLLEDLLRKYNIVITGPTTIAAMLNSLQVGFKTLAIQERTSEVWKILKYTKKEFSNFGLLLHQAKNKIQGASKDIDKLLENKMSIIEKKLNNLDKN